MLNAFFIKRDNLSDGIIMLHSPRPTEPVRPVPTLAGTPLPPYHHLLAAQYDMELRMQQLRSLMAHDVHLLQRRMNLAHAMKSRAELMTHMPPPEVLSKHVVYPSGMDVVVAPPRTPLPTPPAGPQPGHKQLSPSPAAEADGAWWSVQGVKSRPPLASSYGSEYHRSQVGYFFLLPGLITRLCI